MASTSQGTALAIRWNAMNKAVASGGCRDGKECENLPYPLLVDSEAADSFRQEGNDVEGVLDIRTVTGQSDA